MYNDLYDSIVDDATREQEWALADEITAPTMTIDNAHDEPAWDSREADELYLGVSQYS